MIIITLFMLLVPGLIAIRTLWRDKEITSKVYKFILCDYLIYSFLIQMLTYGFMFLTYPERTVSFAVSVVASSHILAASFVFKYSLVALILALILPKAVPWLSKLVKLDKKKGN